MYPDELCTCAPNKTRVRDQVSLVLNEQLENGSFAKLCKTAAVAAAAAGCSPI